VRSRTLAILPAPGSVCYGTRQTKTKLPRGGGELLSPNSSEAGVREDGPNHEPIIILAALAGVVALCWWWLINSAELMHMPASGAAAMAGMAGIEAKLPLIPYFAAAFLMWALMMVAMMVPTAMPMVLHYARFCMQSAPRNALLSSLIFAGCYMLVWIVFALLAALAQTALVRAGVVGRMALTVGSDKFAAFLLAVTALYELSPIKSACLGQCRSPLGFVSQRWQPGVAGAIRLGFGHGAYCLGCWLLMLLLFVGGVMNLLWVALLTIVVIVEKAMPPKLMVEKWLAGAMMFGALALLVL